MLPSILRRDGIYAGGFRHNYAGVAERHSLTLDLGREAAPTNKAVLFLNGWVDWADGSTFFGASQGAAEGLILPYLQVKDQAGNWQTVIEDMGIPAGKPKTIAVDLSGKFLSASREIRIVTNLCVYWDEIFLSEETGPPPARLTPLDVASADVQLRGFSRPVIHERREQPESFEYANWTGAGAWNQTPGLYTRYGDVRELVSDVDDRFVIMGAGDELRLRFADRGLPPLAPNWRRDFLLLVDGWAKDADANTAFSQTVEPLPFHAMSRYPYPPSEHYPDDASHQFYRSKYNTRPAIRFVPSLLDRPGTRSTLLKIDATDSFAASRALRGLAPPSLIEPGAKCRPARRGRWCLSPLARSPPFDWNETCSCLLSRGSSTLDVHQPMLGLSGSLPVSARSRFDLGAVHLHRSAPL